MPDREAIAAPRSHNWTHPQGRRPPGRHSAPLADRGKAAGCASPVPRVKFLPEALVRSAALFDPRATRKVSMARALQRFHRILERLTLTPRRTWVGTDPFVSRVKYIQRRLLGTPCSPASCLGRWTGALGFTRGLAPLTADYEFKQHER
jgi:hypothetical protein